MKEKKYFRNCPICKKELGYTNKKNRNRAEKKKQKCWSCIIKEVNQRPEVKLRFKKMGEDRKIKYKGEGNPFYGKKHSLETIKKLKESHRLLDKKNNPIYQSKEFKDKSVRPGKLNGMYGKNFYNIWIEKYGEEEANKRMEKYRKKQSILNSGEKNNMYGRPAPRGSGGGWSGWYKGWFFRSLKELSYMINVIEKKNYNYENGEKLSIKYFDWNNKERTYRPDFILNKEMIIEVKPKKLMETPSNILKKEASIKYCKKNNMKYKMVDVKIIEIEKIIELFLNKKIRFTDKYKNRIEEIIKRKEQNENL